MKKLLLICVISVLAACGMKMGEEALSLMTEDQRSVVKASEQFSSGTTIEDISRVFGAPIDMGVGGLNPEWQFIHEGKETRLRAYFITGGLDKVQYISPDPMWGYVIYYDESGVRDDT